MRKREMISFDTRAEELLAEARRLGEGKRGIGYKDDKCFIDSSDIVPLIIARAEIIELNYDKGNHYTHWVVYKGHNFVSASSERVLDI